MSRRRALRPRRYQQPPLLQFSKAPGVLAATQFGEAAIKVRVLPMKPFFCVLRVLLNERIVNLDSAATAGAEKPLIGYYRSVGVTATGRNHAMGLLVEAAPDGRIDW